MNTRFTLKNTVSGEAVFYACLTQLVLVTFKVFLLAACLNVLVPDLTNKQVIGIAIALYIAIGSK